MALTTLSQLKTYLGVTGNDYDAQLTALLAAVEAEAERFCGRTFELTSYSKARFDGSGDTRLLLDNWPVVSVSRVSIGAETGMTVLNTSSDASYATAAVSTTALTLAIVGGAYAGTNTLAFSTYTTLGVLDDAVVALGSNWTATTSSAKTSAPSTELLVEDAYYCLNAAATLYVPYTPVWDYTVYRDRGEIYYGGGFPCGARNVTVDYSAGYAAIPQDLQAKIWYLTQVAWKNAEKDPTLTSERLGDHAWSSQTGNVFAYLPYEIMATTLSGWKRENLASVGGNV